MKKKTLPSFVSEVFQILEDNSIEYAVLRNFDGLPEYNSSRDIDILIKKQDFYVVCQQMVLLCQRENIYIVSYFKSERLRTFVCGSFGKDSIEIVQFDFFVHTSAYGHIILTAEEMLRSRIKENGIYHVSDVYQLLDKYLYIKYIGAPFPDKYIPLKESLRNSQELTTLLKSFDISSLVDLEKMSKNEFHKKVRNRGNDSLSNIVLFWKCYILNLISYKGYSIGFTGPDGAGKTTIVELLKLVLNTVYSKIVQYHFRPIVFGNISEVAHTIGLKKEVDRNYNQPHRGNRTSIISSLLRLTYYSIDYIYGYIKKVRKELVKRQIVIFDRYYTDIICDSRRSRIYLPLKFLYWWGRCFIPSLDYNILLTAHTDTILGRKNELNREGIEAINARIDYLANKSRFYKVLNEGTPQEAVTEILRVVFENQHKKNMKRLIKNGSQHTSPTI